MGQPFPPPSPGHSGDQGQPPLPAGSSGYPDQQNQFPQQPPGRPQQPPQPGHPQYQGQPPQPGHPQYPGQPQQQPQYPGQPPHPPGHPGAPGGPPPGGRRPRTLLTVALTASVTLAVLGSLTWVVATSYGSSTGVGSVGGLPTDDPCAVVDEGTLSALDGEVASWHTNTYGNGCSWTVTLDDEGETSLYYSRSVPMSGTDADLVEEFDDELEVPRDVDALYERSVEGAAELAYTTDTMSVSGTRDRPLQFGDESVIVLTDISYGSAGSGSQRVYVVVREGGVVSQLNYTLTVLDDESIDLDEAEELISDVAADAFG
ncbi:transglycosylase SLT domain-containing protein [Nocardiopsis ganjiahuensis]|uniref:hypothetical protein n=1 Tax=Nocardiopsis ganjiahuensis TaxID=239984 RepID=UPI0003470A0A|nr:hypothetical protein [Nocardiopsis ganjiahuensis]